jgi:hypothetical protein
MKLYDIPVNTLVELQFYYMDERHMVSSALLYKYADTVYVTAVKSAGKTIPAKKLKNFDLIYKNDAAVYSFSGLNPRSVSYSGQNLYALQTEQEAKPIGHRNAYRLLIGRPVTAKIIAAGSPRYISCILKDISMTGMGIISKVKIEEFAKIEISFSVNENSQETLTASIIHTREFRSGNGYLYGCEFDNPNEIIGKYIARRLEMIREKAE